MAPHDDLRARLRAGETTYGVFLHGFAVWPRSRARPASTGCHRSRTWDAAGSRPARAPLRGRDTPETARSSDRAQGAPAHLGARSTSGPAAHRPRIDTAEDVAARRVVLVASRPTGRAGSRCTRGRSSAGRPRRLRASTTRARRLPGRECLGRRGADEIAAIDGVDVLFVGPADLSHSARACPANSTSPSFSPHSPGVAAGRPRQGGGHPAVRPSVSRAAPRPRLHVHRAGSDGGFVVNGPRPCCRRPAAG